MSRSINGNFLGRAAREENRDIREAAYHSWVETEKQRLIDYENELLDRAVQIEGFYEFWDTVPMFGKRRERIASIEAFINQHNVTNLTHAAYMEAEEAQHDADTQNAEIEKWLGTLTPEQIDFVAWATDDAADWRDEQATRQSEHPTPLG